MENGYYTYVLQSLKDGKKYTGYTKDLKLRFERHQSGYVESTKHRRPFKLIYYEWCKDEEDAKRREKYLKTFYGAQYITKRLKSYSTGIENIFSTVLSLQWFEPIGKQLKR